MAKRHGAVELDQTGRLRRLGCALGDPETLCGAPEKRGVADRLGRGEKQQALCVSRKRQQPPREALLDPGREGQCSRQPESAGELAWAQPARELEHGEWVPTGLGDDPFEHGLVEARREDGLEQRARIPVTEGLNPELGKARKIANGIADREDQRDPFGKQSSRDERERLGRRTIEPLCVVDEAEQRLLLGGVREKTENREPDEKRVRRRAVGQSEGDAERVTLWIRETLGELEERRTELLQRRVVELHLPLDTGSPNNAKVLAGIDRVLEQRGLADAGVSVHTRTAP